MSRWQWIGALVVTAAVSLPSASHAQDWTSVSGTAAPNEAAAAAEFDDEPRNGAQRYQMRENLVSFGDEFWIENDRGERVFCADRARSE